MHKCMESLKFVNARTVETLTTTDFRLTFRTMRRQTGSRFNVFLVNLDLNEDTTIKEVSFGFMGLGVDKILFEVRSTSDDEPQEF